MSKSVTMAELARMFNVSKVTISNALNDKDGISPKLKEKIKAKAVELGWRFNSAARSLKTTKSYNIGILIAERYIGNRESYYLGVYSKLSAKLVELGYSCILETLTYEKEMMLDLPLMYKDSKIDAILNVGQLNYEYLKLFEKVSVPVIFVDFYDFKVDIDSISLDNYTSCYFLAQYLINNGHSKIGFVGNIYTTSSIQDRYLGFCRAMLENELQIDPEYLVSDRNKKGEWIPLDLKKIPTAYICNNDQIAFVLIKKLQGLGMRVPEDVSVVAFDNTLYSIVSTPSITTIDSNIDDFVERASKAIIKKISSEKVYGRIFVQGNIIERDSVKKM